jgi:hypothetical protein
MSRIDAYRRIDALLEARACDYPRRVEPTWSELLAAIDDVAVGLRAAAERDLNPTGEIPRYYEAPVFVVGHRKTGTTLVLDLLDAHPRLQALPGESNHFLTFLPRFGGLYAGRVAAEAQRWWLLRLITPSGIPPFWAAGRPWELDVDPYELFTRRLLELGRDHPALDPLGLVAVALHAAMNANREPAPAPVAWVEKTPGQEHRVDEILARYPEARFVHVLRDPRSVAAALRRLDRARDAETDLVAVGLTVGRSFDTAEQNATRLGDSRYLVLRYENLVADPRGEMRRAAAFVGIDWADSLLTPTVGGVEATSNSAWSDRQVTGEIEAARLDLWRGELDAREAELVCGGARAAARGFGYELPRSRHPGAVVGVAVRRARLALGGRRR